MLRIVHLAQEIVRRAAAAVNEEASCLQVALLAGHAPELHERKLDLLMAGIARKLTLAVAEGPADEVREPGSDIEQAALAGGVIVGDGSLDEVARAVEFVALGEVLPAELGMTDREIGVQVAVRLLNSCGECYYCRSGHENLCVASFVAHTHSGVMGAGGFAEYMTVSAKAVYKLADDVDLDHAALAEPLACCVHSIRNARIQLGDDVVVIGAGIMGALHIRLAKMSGARVIVSELDPVRMDVARKMGADIVINANEADPIAQVKELTEGRGADAVFCTVATSAVAKQAVDMAGKLGRVVMYTSFFPDLPIEISPTKLHSGEQILTGSVNPNPVDFLTATRLLSRKLIDVSALISDRVPMAEIDRAFREAVEPNTYRIIVKP